MKVAATVGVEPTSPDSRKPVVLLIELHGEDFESARGIRQESRFRGDRI